MINANAVCAADCVCFSFQETNNEYSSRKLEELCDKGEVIRN
jgi:hypothetical protein